MHPFIVFSLSFILSAMGVYILATASSFFIPLIIAIVIGYFIISLAEGAKKIPFNGWTMPTPLAYLAAIAVLLGGVALVAALVGRNVALLLELAPEYQERLTNLIASVQSTLGVSEFELPKAFADINVVTVLSKIALTITDVAGSAGMIAIYVLFFLIETSFFDQKLKMCIQNKQSRDTTHKMIEKISSQVQAYIRLKTGLSLLTAGCSYVLLFFVGVDFAGFWALLIFLLNFIPTIGSIIATIFPILWTILQFDSLVPFAVVATGLALIQFAIGNALEPRIMGSRFNLSGLVIVLSLVIWGNIWGIIGMVLCVPIMMILSIIFANFPQTRPIAVLLSQDGNIE